MSGTLRCRRRRYQRGAADTEVLRDIVAALPIGIVPLIGDMRSAPAIF